MNLLFMNVIENRVTFTSLFHADTIETPKISLEINSKKTKFNVPKINFNWRFRELHLKNFSVQIVKNSDFFDKSADNKI